MRLDRWIITSISVSFIMQSQLGVFVCGAKNTFDSESELEPAPSVIVNADANATPNSSGICNADVGDQAPLHPSLFFPSFSDDAVSNAIPSSTSETVPARDIEYTTLPTSLKDEELLVMSPESAGFDCSKADVNTNPSVGDCLLMFKTLPGWNNKAQKTCYGPGQVCIKNLICPTSHPNRCLDGCYSDKAFICHDDHYLCHKDTPILGSFNGQKVCYDGKLFQEKDGTLVFIGSDPALAQLDPAIALSHEA